MILKLKFISKRTFIKKKIIVAFLIIIFISSCGNHAKMKTTNADEIPNNNSESSVDSISQNNIRNSVTITILKPGSDTLIESSYVDGAKKQKIISVMIVSGHQLFATIYKKNKNSNIRINQIEMPDSTLDGPFGDSMHYQVKMPGVYKFRIGPDLMADGNRAGDFILKAWIK